ncbi:amino acid aminotransferase [Mycolicibacterium fortuitum]|uniref:amino acid aminotransferase n=1 Tax=Mycolicibacterium fortuitum TaxID=1766 RepID=UPI00148FA6FB|nr:amino acid aminotransferase [Mycolicibacterium fortuitum]
MTTNRYTAPAGPHDPVAAALDYLVHAPEVAGAAQFCQPLQDLATVLDAEDAFTGLGWADAHRAAATIAFDAIAEENPDAVLRDRARVLLAEGCSGWDDPQLVARAFRIAATILDIW